MPLSPAQIAYRQRPEEREKRRQYAKAHRQRVDVKALDATRKRAERATAEGAARNRALVKADRAKLGRNYLSQLLADETGLPCREIPEYLVALKRDQITLRRLANEMGQAAQLKKEKS